jgi:pSer/pThr/pTyr-binding forkhead associated (FHA) protein
VTSPTTPWGKLIFTNGKEVQLSGERALVGRADHDVSEINPEVDLSDLEGADTTSRIHATIEHIGSAYTVTDLNSTNSTRINGKRLEPDKATPLNDGDTLSFGKVTCTFKKAV